MKYSIVGWMNISDNAVNNNNESNNEIMKVY